MASRISRIITSTHAIAAPTNDPPTIKPVEAAVPLMARKAIDNTTIHTRQAAKRRTSIFGGSNEEIKDH
jgi:hypothetical protein